MTDKNPIVVMKGITIEFPGVKALDGVDLTLYPGEVHALMGENGAGKSTMIKALTGVYKINAGSIMVDGKPQQFNGTLDAQNAGIATVYQEVNLCTNLSVGENVMLGHEKRGPFGIDWKKTHEAAKKYLAQMGLESIDPHTPLSSISIAMQQLVAIARAMVINAKVLILDEPTSSLDTHEVQVLFRIIRQLKSKGISVIFISHKLDEIFEICDRLTVFKDGEYVGDYDIGELNQLKLISLMVGKDTVELERNKQGYEFANAKVIAEMKDIRQGMRLNGINIEIKQGEVVGLAGLLGSGRTELAQVLFGSGMPDNGEIFWWGEKAGIHSPADAIKKGMGFCTEDRKTEGIIPHLSVRENITIALLPKLNSFGFVKTKEQDEIVRSYIDRLKIKTPTPEQAICNLSGGNQQKVLLARWMCMNPKLMILDEPTRGIDVGAKAEIEQLIQEFSKSGISVLMISSEIAELERNCDRIIVMREGRVIGELAGDQISQDKVMETIARGSESEGKTHE